VNKIRDKEYQEIRTWIYRNARQIDLAVWQFLFERGSKEAVLSALSFYQNEDGGFGHTLEADCWNPESSPYTTLYAINILRIIGFTDTRHPLMQGIIRFLESGKHFTGSKWLFNIPTNNDYAHAPWWTYNKEANEYESIGVTVELACFILKYCDRNSNLYQDSLRILKQMTNSIKLQNKHGDMGIGGYCVLTDTIKELGLEEELDYDSLFPIVRNLVHDSIERDTSKWIYYGVRPSNYITSPDNLFYQGNEDIVLQELDYLIETRPENGVWGITWSWFDNNELYPKEFAISENWWKAAKATEKMLFLKNFSRVE
jgi:hypothetical protein